MFENSFFFFNIVNLYSKYVELANRVINTYMDPLIRVKISKCRLNKFSWGMYEIIQVLNKFTNTCLLCCYTAVPLFCSEEAIAMEHIHVVGLGSI